MQRPSPNFRSEEYFLYEIFEETFYSNVCPWASETVLTEKGWENTVQGLGTEAGIKRGKKRKEKRKGRKRQKIEGKEEGKKRAHSPFLRHPFYGRLLRRLT